MMFGIGRREVKSIRQSEVAECGLACLTMIANFYGHSVDLAYLRALFPASQRGLSMGDLHRLAGHFALDGRAFQFREIENFAQLSLPAILHWDGNHFVVLEKIRGQRFVVHDPAHGRRVFDAGDMRLHFSGMALEFMPRVDLEPIVKSDHVDYLGIIKGIDGLSAAVVKLFLMTFALGILSLATPILLQIALDMVLPQADFDLLGLLVVGLALLMLFEAFGKWLRDFVILRAALRLQMQLSRGVLNHALRLPISFFDSHHAGDLLTRMESVEHIKEFALGGLIRSIADAIIAVVVFGMMLFYSPSMTGVVLVAFMLSMFFRVFYFAKAREYTAETLVARSNETSVLFDGFRQITALKSQNATGRFEQKWFSTVVKVAEKDFLAHGVQINAQLFVHSVMILGSIATIYMGVGGVISNTLTVGMLYAFFSLRSSFTEKMESVAGTLMQLSVLRAHVERLAEVITTKPEIQARAPVIIRTPRRKISLENVSVRLGAADKPILSNIDLTIDLASSERIAIIGPSGSGKSTLLKVLASLVRPTSGRMQVDGLDVEQFGLLEYRSNLGAVFAQDGLIRGSVAENVALFDPNADLAEVRRAIDAVGLRAEIEALPQGLATLLGEEDALLSTGQRRRLLAARAVCRRPRLMLLDEITANLDAKSEDHLLASLAEIEGAKIFVSHSDRLLKYVDRVFEMKNGTLQEYQKSKSVRILNNSNVYADR